MRAPAKLKDVAARAGVSPAAVSRFLNGSISLPAATIERIEAAIAFFDYRPNAHARRLSLGRSDTIALVVPEIGNPFFAELAAAAERAAAAEGLGIMLFATENRLERELEYLSRLGRSDVDALLFVTNHADEDGRLAAAIGHAAQVVLLDEDVPGTGVSKVFADNVEGGRLAARALIEAGHRRLFLAGGPPALMSARERAEGFRAAAREAGLPEDSVEALAGDYTVAQGRRAAEAMLASPVGPTAVFAASDQTMLGLLEVFRARGIAVPDEVSIVTFDDVVPLAFFDPAISAIRQSIGEMGRIGVQRVIAGMKGGAAAEVIRLPIEFVPRASVAAPRDSTQAKKPTRRRP
ncbi:LacI family DNA-binding transcriptional regulator [Prosthecomicrobium pneumaticum]|uniref:LacI family transcriptional regulator n=1 Tax=Prosthecomicrobium pneumaticum TaxID=81895 RepID=A0A7W9CU37_9HYPH|nr:LacI family DNA-binding transcriptional regulator [Prosthecomicrobium pneumaticum]MBB5751593.1 LacI family transcriptional regulator [Prosthecomicrobium pneumaticum]